jgi:hypothetical protein
MGKQDNLKDYLIDLYEGIVSKKPNASRNPQNFRAEIESIVTGSGGDIDLTEIDALIGDGVCNSTGGGTGGGSGGGSTPVKMKDVNFYDYDGTLLHSYTVAEAQALTELPPLPTQEGLICQGWNYDLETIKSYNRAVDVGATYITDDGTTRIYITLQEGRTSPVLGVRVKGTVTVDWGDGTTPDVLTGTSTSTVQWTPNHNYASAGDYVIKLTVDGEMVLCGDSSAGSSILNVANSYDLRRFAYLSAVQKIEIGSGISIIYNYCFYALRSLKSVTIPVEITYIYANAFATCDSLKSIVIPKGIGSIENSVFSECLSLTNVILPDSLVQIGASSFYKCASLSHITIPSNVLTLKDSSFAECSSLSDVIIPDSVVSMGKYVFSNCRAFDSIVIPKGITQIPDYFIQQSYNLSRVIIPNGVISIGTDAFKSCQSLANTIVPNSVTSINNGAFATCSGMRYHDFSSHTSIPTLKSAFAFGGFPVDCEIRVPATLYDEWIAATNWSSLADNIVAV